MVLANSTDDYSIKVKLLYDIASSLNHLHDNDIIHRDLKPTNILIKKSNIGFTPKIADFGISRIMAHGMDHYTATNGGLGTPVWCPPEVLNDENLHIITAVDMFAYGCIVHFQMCPSSKPQFRHLFGRLTSNICVEDILRGIKTGKRFSYISTIAYQLPKAIDKVKRLFADILIQDLINVNPKNRPSIKHVLNFPLFWDVPMQLHFLTDQRKFLHEKQDQHYEDNCLKFFTYKRLSKMCVKPKYWGTVAEQLTLDYQVFRRLFRRIINTVTSFIICSM